MSASVLWNPRPSTTGRQIVMFPYLGGFGASFNGLVRHLSGDWDIWTVNPPGHGPSRLSPVGRLDDLVECYVESLNTVLRPGAVFFGHSMGGVVAYHVMLVLSAQPRFENRCPESLVLSACGAPRQLTVDGYARLPDSELLQHLRSFAAIPDEVVRDSSLIELFLPAFRADYQVLEQAKRLPPMRLHVPTTLILGGQDPHTPDGTAAAWQDYLTQPIRTHVLEREDHMFVLHAIEPLDRILNDVGSAAKQIQVAGGLQECPAPEGAAGLSAIGSTP